MEAKFTFLGTGSSMGIPVIGCTCNVCKSKNPYNKRLRSSALIQVMGKNILIDVGPDFREQALRENIDRLDGIILTHLHFDHIAGIDELRIYNFRQKKQIPCLLSKDSLQELNKRYGYLFKPHKDNHSFSVKFDYHVLKDDFGEINFLGVKLSYFSYFQGGMKVTGFRIGNLAYVIDIKEYDSKIFTYLKGVEKLILSALRDQPSYVHFSVQEALQFAKQVGAKKTWLTHIAHELEHESTNESLKSHIQLAHDGLNFEFEVEKSG